MHYIEPAIIVVVLVVGFVLKFRPGRGSVFEARAAANAAATAEARAAGVLEGALWSGLMEVTGVVPGLRGLAQLSPSARYGSGSGLLVIRPDAVVFCPRNTAAAQGVSAWSIPPSQIIGVSVRRQQQGPRLVTLRFADGTTQRFASVFFQGLEQALKDAGAL